MIDLIAIGQELERELKGEFVALYLVGSYGTSKQIPNSDVDLIMVTRTRLKGEELKPVWALRDGFRRSTGELIDINPRDLASVVDKAIALKEQSKYIYGEDIRDKIRVPSVDERIGQLVSAALMFSRRTHKTEELDPAALKEPDPNDEFLGYLDTHKPLPLKAIMSFSFHASARLAVKERILVLDKHEIPSKYASVFSDPSCRFVEDLFMKIRGRWHYAMPTEPSERDDLKRICAGIVPFEQMVLPEIIQHA